MKTRNVILLLIIIILLNFVITKQIINRNAPKYSPRILETLSIKNENELLDSNRIVFEERTIKNQNLEFSRENAITKAVELVHPSVVSVNVIKTEIIRSDPFHSFFFDNFF
ncbi:MAG: hypothetical protein KAW87_08460, partial [Candidatus Cloacimonetes bacterium]|nr:hypothetical protein [Candidatus Cloacimonadota bacterium]